MSATKTFSVNDAGDPEPVVTIGMCRSVAIREDPSVSSWPTTNYKVYEPTSAATPVEIVAGETYPFALPSKGFWNAGETIGYVATVTGATTFSHREE